MKLPPKLLIVLLIGLSPFFACRAQAQEKSDTPIRVMLLTGQSNKYHNWQSSSTAIHRHLLAANIFSVDLVVSPAGGESMEGFAPNWSAYDVVVLDYEGAEWPADTKAAFVDYMKNGGGLVTIHATDNSFPQWPEFNQMIGVGGWGGAGFHSPPLSGPPEIQQSRNEEWGPRVYWDHCHMVRDTSPGGAWHPAAHEWLLTVRDPDHPVTNGLPEVWLQGKDELYCGLRGPAKNLSLLATGFANPDLQGASPHNEPILMAIAYGKGRVFHSTLGHVGPHEDSNVKALNNVSFIVTLQRGTEWAATGAVTQAVPEDFPTAYRASYRPSEEEH